MSLERTLLIVENDQGQRDQMCRRFLRAGFSVTPVNHMRCALEAATFRRFDVAIVDATQSEIDGLQLAARLRGLVAGLRVIVRCDDLRSLTVDSAQNDQAIWLVAKTQDLDELERAVEWAIDAGSRPATRRGGRNRQLASS